ncbi:MAG TPA: long-chain fatty acid--CoA ligase [Acidimicrobiales bacterium]|nr:long-chain fatty acid--CoA ligase [Acidimicrobiales bacterium]
MTMQTIEAPAGGADRAGGTSRKAPTIVSALVANATLRPDRPAMRYRDAGGSWSTITWKEYETTVSQVAAGLAALGLEPGARVAILASNCPEWHFADLGILANRCVTVPIYPTSSPAQISYILRHSGASICFVDTHDQVGKVLLVRDEVPSLRYLVLTDHARRESDTFVTSFSELTAIGADHLGENHSEVTGRMQGVVPEDLATIVYTSGTTGPPKGAMITHENIMWTLRQVTPVYGLTEGERFISFLPLSHIAERMMSDFTPIAVVGETWFARSLATLAEDLPSCRPTVFLAVPRVWQKLRSAIEEQVSKQPPPVRTVFSAYLALGRRVVKARQRGDRLPGAVMAAYRALDGVVGAQIRRTVGLDHARIVVSAAAPIHSDLIEWFHAVGLPMLQIYGQTESCGPTTANRIDHNRIGTVGSALPGMTVRVGADGEVLLKGGNVCLGYLDDPKATAELIDEDGWMHSGDVGEFDDDGDLRITGRKKDLIITASGKNVAPQEIESDLCNDALISEAVVVGEGRKYLTALVTLDGEELSRWAQGRNKLDDLEALTEDPDLIGHVQQVVDSVNARRSQAESVRKFRILPRDLTAASGELTPTMKVKRFVVYSRYAGLIDGMYGAG